MNLEEIERIPGAQDDCEALQADENACATCAFYIDCWEESPDSAARAEYDRSRGV